MYYDVGRRKIEQEKFKPKLSVDIVAFVLCPISYHLLVTPKIENGVALFMKNSMGIF